MHGKTRHWVIMGQFWPFLVHFFGILDLVRPLLTQFEGVLVQIEGAWACFGPYWPILRSIALFREFGIFASPPDRKCISATFGLHHTKRSLIAWVVVIPKEGGMHRLSADSSFGMTTIQDFRDLFPGLRPFERTVDKKKKTLNINPHPSLIRPFCHFYSNHGNQFPITSTIENMAAFTNSLDFQVTFSKVLLFFIIVKFCKIFFNNVNSHLKGAPLFSCYPENPSESIPNKAIWTCFLTTSQWFFPQFATFKMRGWGGKIQIKDKWLNLSSHNQRIWWRTPTIIQWCQKEYTHFNREKIFCISRAVNFLFLTTVHRHIDNDGSMMFQETQVC